MERLQVWTYIDKETGKVQIDQRRHAPTGTHPVSEKGKGWVEAYRLEEGEYCYDLDDHGEGKGDGTQVIRELTDIAGTKTPRGYHTIWLGQRRHTGKSGFIDYKGPKELLFAPPTPGYQELPGTPRVMTDEEAAIFDRYLSRSHSYEASNVKSVKGIPVPKVRTRKKLPTYYSDAGHRTQQVLCDCTKPYKAVWHPETKSKSYVQVESRHAELFSIWRGINKDNYIDARWLGEAKALFDMAMDSWVCPNCTHKNLSFEREVNVYVNKTDAKIANRAVVSEKTEMMTPFLPTRGIVNINGQSLSGKTRVVCGALLRGVDLPVVWITCDNPQRDLWTRFDRPIVNNGREVVENTHIYSFQDSEDEVSMRVLEAATLVDMVENAVYESGLGIDDRFVVVIDTVQGIMDRRITNEDIGAPQAEHRKLLQAFPKALFLAIHHSPKNAKILLSGKAASSGTSGWGAIPRVVINVGRVVGNGGNYLEVDLMATKDTDTAFTVVSNDMLPTTYLARSDSDGTIVGTNEIDLI